eukprot:CAMPEP_0197687048 /NCGR_PEP_ID=MMETSP1338-20131121/103439_1 /TAXON_ID=43686 ORGANISM="Pelagodinium beii, Strain RCC1491" /NCGR_SAMPLE_ID=MMETSP1338 /ASSEMBLY_ACC=CAM_ASM_000754 /LENGTH=36 /DNA_ID= /DNA_START= /DNA_END= /DNA_ORIENTATION=
MHAVLAQDDHVDGMPEADTGTCTRSKDCSVKEVQTG